MPELPRRPPIVSHVIAFEGVLILLAWALAWVFDRPLFELIVFDWEGIVAGFLATVPLYAAMIWSAHTSMPPFPRLRCDFERLVVPMFRGISWWDLVLIALLAGVGEELFFRGLLQPGLGRWIGVWPAVILTSVVFGALHWITPAYALVAGLIGLYLGAFMVVSGNLIVPILVHALYDFFALRYLLSRSTALAEKREGAAGTPEHPDAPAGRDHVERGLAASTPKNEPAEEKDGPGGSAPGPSKPAKEENQSRVSTGRSDPNAGI